MIELINVSGKPVLSLDIPSGVNGDTGEIMGTAVRADHTVTFGLPKIGNMLYPGCGLCGTLHVCRISFPPSLYDDEAIAVEINGFVPLPPRERTAHKGSVGDVLFIAGAAGYFGAPYFSAMSFLKAGGGYARLAAPWSMTPFLATRGSEIVFVPQAETTEGSLSLKNKDALLALAGRVDMVVIGPGLSLAEETQELVRELAAGIEKPLLIDGDGITALAGQPEIIRNRRAPTILTPHPGEMSRLTGKSISEIEKRRIPILQETAADLKAWIVLKGARSLIGTPGGEGLHQPERESRDGDGGVGGCPDRDDRRHVRPRAAAGGGGPQGGVHPWPLPATWPRRTRGRTGSRPRISSTTSPTR